MKSSSKFDIVVYGATGFTGRLVCAELAARGVTLLNGPMDRPWGIRTASFTDPSGHIWEIAGDLPAD